MEITPSTSTESVETITPTQNTHTQSTEKTKLSISEDTQEFVNNFCRIANNLHHVKAEAEKANQIESDKQFPIPHNEDNKGSDTNQSDPQPIVTPNKANIPNWEDQDLVNQPNNLDSERAKFEKIKSLRKQRKASKAKRRLDFSKEKHNPNAVSNKPILNTSDLQAEGFEKLLPEEIRPKRIPKSVKRPVDISTCWHNLVYTPEKVQANEHWRLPLNTIEKQAYLQFVKENKVSVNNQLGPLHYNARSYIDRIKGALKRHRQSKINQEGKALWKADRANYHHSKVKPVWYFAYDPAYYVPLAQLERQAEKEKAKSLSKAKKSNQLPQAKGKQNKTKQEKEKKAQRSVPSRSGKVSTNTSDNTSEIKKLVDNRKNFQAPGQVTESAPTDSFTILSDLLLLQAKASSIDNKFDKLTEESSKELVALLENTFKWVKKHHSYDSFLTAKTFDIYTKLISNTNIGGKLGSQIKIVLSDHDQDQKSQKPSSDSTPSEPQTETDSSENNFLKLTPKEQLLQKFYNIIAKYLWAVEYKVLVGHTQEPDLELLPIRARPQRDGSSYNCFAYRALAEVLHPYFREDLEENPAHLFEPASEKTEVPEPVYTDPPCTHASLAYTRFYCNELLRQAYYPDSRSLKFDEDHYIKLAQVDQRLFQTRSWVHKPEFQGLDTVEGPNASN
jgi:hypothetical protein